MMKLNLIVRCAALQLTYTVVYTSSLLSKYPTQNTITIKHSFTKETYPIENFVDGLCKEDVTDLTIYGKGYDQCVQECRSRTLCKSINVYSRAVKVCRLNFLSDLEVSKCQGYVHSVRANWRKKFVFGCEQLNCSVSQKCVLVNKKHMCVNSECRNILNIPSGIALGNHVDFGKTRAIRCNRGYRLIGQSSITCHSDGNWSNDIPVCNESATTKQTDTRDTNKLIFNTTTSPEQTAWTAEQETSTIVKTLESTSSKPPGIKTDSLTTMQSTESITYGTQEELQPTTTQYSSLTITRTNIVTDCPGNSCVCPIGSFYNSPEQNCVHECPSRLRASGYQTYPDYSIKLDEAPYGDDVEPDILTCQERCIAHALCTIISTQSGPNGNGGYLCKYYSKQHLLAEYIDYKQNIDGDILFVFHCEQDQTSTQINQNITTNGLQKRSKTTGSSDYTATTTKPTAPIVGPYHTSESQSRQWKPCALGNVYNHGLGICMTGCKQDSNTYQRNVDITLSGIDLHPELSRMEYTDVEECLDKCTSLISCYFVQNFVKYKLGDTFVVGMKIQFCDVFESSFAVYSQGSTRPGLFYQYIYDGIVSSTDRCILLGSPSYGEIQRKFNRDCLVH